MKNLKLNRVDFAGAKVLTRAQLKKIMGGDGGDYSATCGTYPSCNSNECVATSGPCQGFSGTCGSSGSISKCTCAVVC